MPSETPVCAFAYWRYSCVFLWATDLWLIIRVNELSIYADQTIWFASVSTVSQIVALGRNCFDFRQCQTSVFIPIFLLLLIASTDPVFLLGCSPGHYIIVLVVPSYEMASFRI